MNHKITVLFLLAFFGLSLAGEKTSTEPGKPSLIVTPQSPTVNTDNVILQIMIGTASNPCKVPSYKDLSSTIEPSLPDIDPQINTIKVNFTEVPSSKICIEVVQDPVDYGPIFDLGKLPAGIYRVVYGGTDPKITNSDFGNFTVEETPIHILATYTVKGTVKGETDPITTMSSPVSKAKIYLVKSAIPIIQADESTEPVILPPVQPLDSATTDIDGNYALTEVAAGSYKLFCTNGVQTVSVSAIIRSDTIINFVLGTLYKNSASKTLGGATFTVATDKFIYKQDEPVRIRYTIANTTSAAISYGPFSKGCEYDLLVTYGNSTAEKVIYRESDHPICVDMISTIDIDPGTTHLHDFPAWYVPDVKLITAQEGAIEPRSVPLTISVRLRGDNYDDTKISVPVEYKPSISVGTSVAERINRSAAVSFNAGTANLTINLNKAQTVSVAVYSLDGSMIPASSLAKQMPAGMHTLSLRNALPSGGLYVIGVKGANFEKRFSTINMRK